MQLVPRNEKPIFTHKWDRTPDLANEEAVSCCIIRYSGKDLQSAKLASDHLPAMALFKTDENFRDAK